jgi:hypothetical protein
VLGHRSVIRSSGKKNALEKLIPNSLEYRYTLLWHRFCILTARVRYPISVSQEQIESIWSLDKAGWTEQESQVHRKSRLNLVHSIGFKARKWPSAKAIP